ncbi:MAG TPA: hypothetical protein PLB01_00230 [Thermoanaerobaculia bacterium]|nr:hypothetical protein [Thermoanaerobaculia bacterium]
MNPVAWTIGLTYVPGCGGWGIRFVHDAPELPSEVVWGIRFGPFVLLKTRPR